MSAAALPVPSLSSPAHHHPQSVADTGKALASETLTETRRRRLAQCWSHVIFATDETIVANAATDRELFVLLEGSVRARKLLHLGPAEDYSLDLKVMEVGDVFGGDRFACGLPLFQDLSFIAVGSVQCLQLTRVDRRLDSRARSLLVEDFTWVPEEQVLARAFSEQETWELHKSALLAHQFKAAVGHTSRGGVGGKGAVVPHFAQSLSRQTLTRASRYLPSGSFVGFGRDGRHSAETPSQFQQRRAAARRTQEQWNARLSSGVGGRASVGPGRVVASVPLALTRWEALAAEAEADEGASGSGRLSAVMARSRRRSGSARRPPKPVTPHDFGAPWTCPASQRPLSGVSMATDAGSEMRRMIATPDSLGADDSLGWAGAGAEQTGFSVPVSEMWPDGEEGGGPAAVSAATAAAAVRRPVSAASWGMCSLLSSSSPSGSAAAEGGPQPADGFSRMLLQRLVETTVQHAMTHKQARSSQYYPEMGAMPSLSQTARLPGWMDGHTD